MYCLLMVWLEQQEDMVPSHLHAFDPSSHQQASNCQYGERTYVRPPVAVLSFVCKSVWVCCGHCHVVDKTSVCASVGISALLCPHTQPRTRLPPWRRWYQDLRLEAYHGDYQYIRHHYYCLKDGCRRILNTRWLECQVYLP